MVVMVLCSREREREGEKAGWSLGLVERNFEKTVTPPLSIRQCSRKAELPPPPSQPFQNFCMSVAS
jgi:hypothetical protein